MAAAALNAAGGDDGGTSVGAFMVAKLDTKTRTILAVAAGVAGGVWCMVLGFPIAVCLLTACGATLPIWVMSRGVLHESRPDRTAAEPLADIYPIGRARVERNRRSDETDPDRLTG